MVLRPDPEEQFTSGCWRSLQHIQGVMFIDSSAVVFACPPSFVVSSVNLSSSGLKLRSASGTEVEHFGTTSVRWQLGNQACGISFEVAAQWADRFSLSWLEDAGWTF